MHPQTESAPPRQSKSPIFEEIGEMYKTVGEVIEVVTRQYGSPGNWEISRCVTRQYERPGHQQRLLQTFTKDVFIFSLLVYIAHWSFLDDALYKFTYLLTYLLSFSVCFEGAD